MDRKRVNGPESSVAPIYRNSNQDNVQILNNDLKRLDNRGVEDVRPMCMYYNRYF
jgi:exosome complex component MTR3